MARPRRRPMGAFARDHAGQRPEDVLRSAGRDRRGRQRAGGGGEMTVPRSVVAVVAVLIVAASAAAQPRGPVPRGPDKKPDLTGVWQAGNTLRGPWQEANAGIGLGGSGRNPTGPTVQSSTERPAGAEAAPYQAWAAAKVVEAFNRRGIDDPTALCLPPGVPRVVMLGL